MRDKMLMINQKRFFLLLFTGLTFRFWIYAAPCFAADIVINEFAAVTAGSVEDPDWIELYNTTDENIDLNGWSIKDSTDSNKIDLSGYICSKSFRKFNFSNRLNNGGDEIRLFDQVNNLISSISYFSATIPEHQQGESTGRNPDGTDNWIIFNSPTPSDRECVPPASPTLIPPTNTPTPTPPSGSYPDDIYIVEFMANPSEGDEWVELYNDNDHSVSLSNWKIKDETDSNYHQFSLEINAESRAVTQWSGYFLNNDDEDTIILVRPDNEVIDAKSYSSTTKGKSWSKDNSGDWCELDPTKNQNNSVCPQETSSPTSTPINSPTPTPKLTPTVTPKVTPTATPTITPTPTPEGEILGATESASSTDSSTPNEGEVKGEKKSNRLMSSPYFGSALIIGLGLILIIAGVSPFWLPKLKALRYNSKQGEKS